MKIYVIGGMNIDIKGIPYEKLVPHDSNLGKIIISFGGVARNIATNLSNLGLYVHFITITGDDEFSKLLLADCIKHGLNVDDSIIMKDSSPSFYLALENELHDLEVGINDMDLFNNFTIEKIKPVLDKIEEDDIVVVDTNWNEEFLNYILNHCKGKIFVDPVSGVKAIRLKNCLDRIYGFKPNSMEAEILSGEKGLEKQIKFFKDKGISKLYISAGEDGLYGVDSKSIHHEETYADKIVDATGAGDSVMAGIIYSEFKGLNLEDSVKFASTMAKFTLESKDTVCNDINEKVINDYLDKRGE